MSTAPSRARRRSAAPSDARSGCPGGSRRGRAWSRRPAGCARAATESAVPSTRCARSPRHGIESPSDGSGARSSCPAGRSPRGRRPSSRRDGAGPSRRSSRRRSPRAPRWRCPASSGPRRCGRARSPSRRTACLRRRRLRTADRSSAPARRCVAERGDDAVSVDRMRATAAADRAACGGARTGRSHAVQVISRDSTGRRGLADLHVRHEPGDARRQDRSSAARRSDGPRARRRRLRVGRSWRGHYRSGGGEEDRWAGRDGREAVDVVADWRMRRRR